MMPVWPIAAERGFVLFLFFCSPFPPRPGTPLPPTKTFSVFGKTAAAEKTDAVQSMLPGKKEAVIHYNLLDNRTSLCVRVLLQVGIKCKHSHPH